MKTLMSESYTMPPERKRWELFSLDVPKPWHAPLESKNTWKFTNSTNSQTQTHILYETVLLLTERFTRKPETYNLMFYCFYRSGTRGDIPSSPDVQHWISILRQWKTSHSLKNMEKTVENIIIQRHYGFLCLGGNLWNGVQTTQGIVFFFFNVLTKYAKNFLWVEGIYTLYTLIYFFSKLSAFLPVEFHVGIYILFNSCNQRRQSKLCEVHWDTL